MSELAIICDKFPEIVDKNGIINLSKQRRGDKDAWNKFQHRFKMYYGKVWISKMRDEESREAWRGIIKSMRYHEIKRAIDALESADTEFNKYPPQILEFKNLGICRSSLKVFFCCMNIDDVACMASTSDERFILKDDEKYYYCLDHIGTAKNEK